MRYTNAWMLLAAVAAAVGLLVGLAIVFWPAGEGFQVATSVSASGFGTVGLPLCARITEDRKVLFEPCPTVQTTINASGAIEPVLPALGASQQLPPAVTAELEAPKVTETTSIFSI